MADETDHHDAPRDDDVGSDNEVWRKTHTLHEVGVVE